MAAAIGAGLPVAEPIGSMVVDIGGVHHRSRNYFAKRADVQQLARVGGDKMDEAICAYVRRKYNLQIGETTEQIKKEIGSAQVMPDAPTPQARFVAATWPREPCEITLNQAEIAEALRDTVSQIVQTACSALEHAKPEIAADMIEQGITMTGGGHCCET
jgi:rod shape-determining protein MreB